MNNFIVTRGLGSNTLVAQGYVNAVAKEVVKIANSVRRLRRGSSSSSSSNSVSQIIVSARLLQANDIDMTASRFKSASVEFDRNQATRVRLLEADVNTKRSDIVISVIRVRRRIRGKT